MIVQAMIGFFLGNLLFTVVLRWLGSVYFIAKDRTRAGSRAKGWKVASVTLLGSGPWTVVVVTFFYYHVHSTVWGVWLLTGTLSAIVFFSVFTWIIGRRIARRRRNDGA